MTVYESTDQFRCDRCTDKSVGGGLIKDLWPHPMGYDQDSHSLQFVVRCFAGHISTPSFLYEKVSKK
jgi:hypothetical protein